VGVEVGVAQCDIFERPADAHPLDVLNENVVEWHPDIEHVRQVQDGEMVADSAGGSRHQGYAIIKAKKPNSGAELPDRK